MSTILVAAGVILERGRVLLSQRKKGTHLAGAWEFPGGKVDDGEDPKATVVRELREELGIDVSVGDIVEATFHRYAEKTVLLLFYEAHRLPHSAEPAALEVAAVRWAAKGELDDDAFPPADIDVLRKVRARLEEASR